MRRALAILKYVPAVLCGLLVVAWVVSIPLGFQFVHYWDNSDPKWRGSEIMIECFESAISIQHSQADRPLTYVKVRRTGNYYNWWSICLGHRPHGEFFPGHNWLYLYVPIPGLLTILLPVAIGCFTRFRFPLWSYFAWTALLAVELVYYLRAG